MTVVLIMPDLFTLHIHSHDSLVPIPQTLYELRTKIFLNYELFHMKSNDLIRLQFCTCHNSSVVVTCAKLWPDWIILIRIRADRIFTRFQLWAHESLWSMFQETGSLMTRRIIIHQDFICNRDNLCRGHWPHDLWPHCYISCAKWNVCPSQDECMMHMLTFYVM